MAKGTQITGEQIRDFTGGGGGGAGSGMQVDQSGGTADTYGVLSGTIDGANTTFTVSLAEYVSGRLEVYLNGQLQIQGTAEDWVETTPASGTFDFITAPEVGDEITVVYSILGSASFVHNEVPSGTVDGANDEFVLASTPATGTVQVYRNGLLQQVTADYTISGSTITFVTPPLVGSIILCTYQLDIAASGNADTLDGYHASEIIASAGASVLEVQVFS